MPRSGPDFFQQATPVVSRDTSRVDALTENLSHDNQHLHVGCTDWPIFDPDTNLHLYWVRLGLDVDGLDVDLPGLDVLQKLDPKGTYYGSVKAVNQTYACLMIPDVIEHVPDVGVFLRELSQIDCAGFVLSTPNGLKMHAYVHQGTAYEEVHPDHNYWFTPFTLANCIRKFTHWELTDILLVEDETCMIARGRCR